MVQSKSNITNFISTTGNGNENALELSYGVSHPVARATRVHIIAALLIGPRAP
jgi:hypothetical protein